MSALRGDVLSYCCCFLMYFFNACRNESDISSASEQHNVHCSSSAPAPVKSLFNLVGFWKAVQWLLHRARDCGEKERIDSCLNAVRMGWEVMRCAKCLPSAASGVQSSTRDRGSPVQSNRGTNPLGAKRCGSSHQNEVH